MANRHLSRSIAIQTLYEWDFNNSSKKLALEALDRNVAEFAKDSKDNDYIKSLVEGVIAKEKDLNNIIEKAAPEWPIDKISIIDRNILRLGLYELLFGDRGEVPPKVAINEAIELAKKFGGDTSGKFVNGVLGAVYKEMGEPGKDEKSKRKMHDIPDDEAPVKRLAGAVVYAKEGESIYLALVHDVFGYWTLPKGKLTKDEADDAGVKRVLKDELGLDVELKEQLGDNGYIAHDPEEGKLKKQVTYHLAEAPHNDLKEPESGGLDDIRWFELPEIADLKFYNDILPLVTKAVKKLNEE